MVRDEESVVRGGECGEGRSVRQEESVVRGGGECSERRRVW